MTGNRDFLRLWPRLNAEHAASAFPVVIATLLLLFFSIAELFRFFLAALALGGLYRMLVRRHALRDRWLLLFYALFACLWIPITLSVIDAENPRVAAVTASRYLIYLFAGYLWIGLFVHSGNSRFLLGGAFGVLLFWTANAIFQLLAGVDFFGQESLDGQRLSGMMGHRLTLVLAIMSPVFFHGLLCFGERLKPLWLLIIPYLVAVLFGGSRVSWMLLILSLLLYAGVMMMMRIQFDARRLAVALTMALAIILVAIAQTDWLRDRVTRIGDLFSGDYALVNAAVTNRLPHWEAAARMYASNPINGIGVKNYKFSYFDYAGDDDTFRGQPHLFLLEVAAETGTVGLIGYAVFLALIVATLLRLLRQRRYQAVPWGLALLLAAFPLSATLSLYAHFMSALIWYLAILFVGVAAREARWR